MAGCSVLLDALKPYLGRLIVACSGGADSLALAHAACAHSKAKRLDTPLLVYINHGLRSEAPAEAAHIAKLAERFGADFEQRVVEVSRKGSLEARARDARYAALESVCASHRATWVLLGHTSSDQVETVLMRIFRGTGIPGLAGMPQERGQFARPFLAFSRRDTERYCQTHKLPFVEDEMNRDQRFTRVRIRHHWLPALRKENPQLENAILRLAESARDHREILDWAARSFLNQQAKGLGLLVGEAWRSVPDSLAIRALALFAESRGRRELQSVHLKSLLALTRGSADGTKECSLPGGPAFRQYGTLYLPSLAEEDSPIAIEVPQGYEQRTWRPGDRMRPERLKGRSKKLSDLFAEAKIPRHQRLSAVVVTSLDTGDIVWAQYLGSSWQTPVQILEKVEKAAK
ncbi:MAG: tRNA lysidine(34) synthetase TilS [Kofleriaceae bacterium]|nr:tRNA lysidine(34) synthetase TilS [Kofleriaceae bacterium]